MKFKTFFLPLAIFILSFSLRLYRLDTPLADWHSWRQADTASVSREYVKHGIDLLHPQYMDLSSIPSGKDNPNGYRMVEFPFINALHAWLATNFPIFNLVVWGRLLSAFSSSLTVVIIYLLVSKLSGHLAGFFSALAYAVIPYSVFYGRVILPEPHLALFMMLSLYFSIRFWDSKRFFYYLITLVSLTLSILLKPTSLVILLPIYGYTLTKISKPRHYLQLLFLPVLALTPYVLWRRYILNFPEGIPASEWLFNGNGIRFKGAWFRWLFGERIGKLILGYWGLVPFGLGLFSLGKHKRETLVYGGLLVGSLIYLAVIATGNVQHDYYQVQILPTLAIFVGWGIASVIYATHGLRRWFISSMILGICLLSLALSWYEVRGFFWVNNQAMVKAGQKIDAISAPDALVIAPYMGDTAFLFQTNRRGWPIGGEIDKKIKQGADYYVTTTKDEEYHQLIQQYTLVEDNDEYSIIDLNSRL